ncbi:hypothetical protein Pcinc_040515 [Petrolisthes cinctipes]|uniref:Uncharacterized protein n=1 Tax=Petrolisthes cinctipes TaxID=88211 RepID=A0AAE1BLA7_PETCI|nr:hypothetical protein Pcinc_040515 [Petrolisthes cinctipes]
MLKLSTMDYYMPQSVQLSPLSPKASYLPQELYSLFMNHLDCHSSETTDGSKSSADTSFAVVFPNREYKFRLPSVARVYTAELFAILFALRTIFTSLRCSYQFIQCPPKHTNFPNCPSISIGDPGMVVPYLH